MVIRECPSFTALSLIPYIPFPCLSREAQSVNSEHSESLCIPYRSASMQIFADLETVDPTRKAKRLQTTKTTFVGDGRDITSHKMQRTLCKIVSVENFRAAGLSNV